MNCYFVTWHEGGKFCTRKFSTRIGAEAQAKFQRARGVSPQIVVQSGVLL